MRRALLDAAEADNVEFAEDDFQWPSPVERDEIQRALFGVSLVEHTVRTLLAAHTKVTGRDFEAQGLRSINSFRMDRRSRTRPRPRGIRRDQGVQIDDLIDEYKVSFKFEADNATVHEFLEGCRASRPRVTFGGLKIIQGRPGDPLIVTGEMIALTIKDVPEGKGI